MRQWLRDLWMAREYRRLLQMALTYDPMIDCYKLKELHKRFKKAVSGESNEAGK